jgi:hypothetical protein
VTDAVAPLPDEMLTVSLAIIHESGRYSAQLGDVIFYLAGFRSLPWFGGVMIPMSLGMRLLNQRRVKD